MDGSGGAAPSVPGGEDREEQRRRREARGERCLGVLPRRAATAIQQRAGEHLGEPGDHGASPAAATTEATRAAHSAGGRDSAWAALVYSAAQSTTPPPPRAPPCWTTRRRVPWPAFLAVAVVVAAGVAGVGSGVGGTKRGMFVWWEGEEIEMVVVVRVGVTTSPTASPPGTNTRWSQPAGSSAPPHPPHLSCVRVGV